MKYAVDKIEEGIATLENLDKEEIIYINVDDLPESIHEGAVLIKKEIFELDLNEEEQRRKEIEERFRNLIKEDQNEKKM